jgi:hypothetical protein
MRRHPFRGIVSAANADDQPIPVPQVTERRGFLAQLLASLVGLGAVLWGGSAAANQNYRRSRQVTTQAVGEEGGYRPPPSRSSPPVYTTQALGEEGGNRPPPRYTTYALGEEGSGYRPPANRPSPPRYTTFAMGEEGGGYPPPREPRYTTFALGEEG